MSNFETSDKELLQALDQHSSTLERERFFYETLKERLKTIFGRIRDGQSVTTDPMREPLRLLVQYLQQDPEYLGLMIHLGPEDEEAYRHCVDVAVLSCLYAKTAGWSRDEMITLGLAALFHDAGKMNVSETILRSADELSEEERSALERHPERGVQLLEQAGLNGPLQRAAQNHHERPDGSGYPSGKTSMKKTTKIIAVADTYDALLSHRVYRRGMLPQRIESILEDEFNDYPEFRTIMRGFFKALRQNRFATLARLTDRRLVLLRHYYQTDQEQTVVIGREDNLSPHSYPIDLSESSASIERTLSPDDVPFSVDDILGRGYLGT